MKNLVTQNSRPLVFRKWNNKGYAIFSSLGRIVKIGVLASAYFLFANTNTAQAQDESSSVLKNIDLESVDVSADELPEAFSSLSRVVSVISKTDIERAAVSSFNELLELVSSIDVRQRGTNGIQADISVRGGTFDQVLILLNGINLTDPQTGHHNLNLPIDFSAIERIEILKGPGAWKFGSGAFSGAINIITLDSDKAFIEIETSAAQFNTYSGKILSAFNTSKVNHLVSVNHGQSEGYTNNTDYKLSNMFYKGTLDLEKNKISLQTGYTTRNFGANSFYTAMYPDQFEEIQTLFAAFSSKSQIGKVLLEPNIYFRRNNDHFLLVRDHPEYYPNFHTNEVLGGNMVASFVHGSNATTLVGVDVRNEKIWSNNLGEDTNNPEPAHQNDTIMLNKYHGRTNISSFVGHKRYFENFMINVGLNITHNSDLDQLFIFPGIDANYSLSSSISFNASINKTMRMPTFTDLYYTGPSNEGNANLLPEEALGFDLGARYQSKIIQCSFTGFYSNGINLIDWVKESVDTKIWHTVNHANINTFGVEWSSKLNVQKLLPNQNILKSFSANYTFIDQIQEESQLISNYSLNYLKHRADFNLTHRIIDNWLMSWHLSIQDRNGQFEKIVNKTSVGLTDFEPFSTINLKTWYAIKGWKASIEVTNLLNKGYYDIKNVPQPGRWFKFGIAKKVKFKR